MADAERERQEHLAEVGCLAAVGVIGQFLTFAVTVLLARSLSVEGFETYVVAAAIYLLLLAVAAQGLDKYALRLMPGKFECGQWQLAADLFRFGVVRILAGALIVGALAALWAREIREFPADTLLAVYLGCLFLPVGVLVNFLAAVLSATGDCVRAAFATLLLVPLVALVLIVLVAVAPLPLTSTSAIACWAGGWLVALVVLGCWVHRAWSGSRQGCRSTEPKPSWRRASLPFWVYRLAMGVVAQSGVVMLDWLQPSATATGAYAAALSMASVAAILAVATNRKYARELSVLMERGDYRALDRYRRVRLQWLVPTLALFLAVVFLFADPLMELFRPEFATEGGVAFRLLSVTIAATVLFGLAPTYLKYRGHNLLTFSTLVICALLQLVLLWWLVPRFEATGAAIAYMLSMLLMYGFLAVLAHYDLEGLRRDHPR
ncbi:lipopolysaccharide biosynthesis protein [Microbulbifer guangxiensis]|uniref:lipopolysaccharide biosynthesis protein n=1 Tax=Microbulbifer guangxiensis TaxID=2904249 RepID=UPI001F16D006|nr:polysaccharide biosynthesis C-terminal domain-containing protein [Microbulbifer guangxiensis]